MNTPSNTWENGPWPRSWHKPAILTHWMSVSFGALGRWLWFFWKVSAIRSAKWLTPIECSNRLCVAPVYTKSQVPSCFKLRRRWNSFVSKIFKQSSSIFTLAWMQSFDVTDLPCLFLELFLSWLARKGLLKLLVEFGAVLMVLSVNGVVLPVLSNFCCFAGLLGGNAPESFFFPRVASAISPNCEIKGQQTTTFLNFDEELGKARNLVNFGFQHKLSRPYAIAFLWWIIFGFILSLCAQLTTVLLRQRIRLPSN